MSSVVQYLILFQPFGVLVISRVKTLGNNYVIYHTDMACLSQYVDLLEQSLGPAGGVFLCHVTMSPNQNVVFTMYAQAGILYLIFYTL